MLISDNTLQKWIDHFYGFGTWQAPVWYVGYEESGGDLPEEVAEKLDYFFERHIGDTPALCDIRDLYRHVKFRNDGPRSELFKSQYDYRFGSAAIIHGIWKNLIAFSHGFHHEPVPDLLAFQKRDFCTATEALIQLYPLPSPHNHAWYYSWLDLPQHSFLLTRKKYEEHLYNQRIRTIFQKLQEHRPEIVVMYAMSNINALKISIQEFYPDAVFKMIKGAKLETPQHHRCQLGDTIVIITTQTPALKHNRIETGFDWEKFGKSITGA